MVGLKNCEYMIHVIQPKAGEIWYRVAAGGLTKLVDGKSHWDHLSQPIWEKIVIMDNEVASYVDFLGIDGTHGYMKTAKFLDTYTFIPTKEE